LLILLGFVVLGMVLSSEMKATAQASQPEAEPPAQVDPLPSQATLLDETWLTHDWPQAIKILETYHKKQPDSLPIKRRLAEAYRRNGLTLRYEGLIEEAQQNFRQALPLDPQNKALEQELTFATNYLTGKQHYQRGEWAEAMAALQSIYTQEPTYANVKDLLFSATYNQGLTLQAQAELPAAQTALAAAIALRPDLAEPRLRLAEVEFALSPETPPEIPIAAVPIKDRLVLVGIAEQRMHVYEGDKLIYDFIVSTGEPGRPTAIGEFEILNKIEVAYASTWNLDMPNWLGIYWAGPLQNGIHSLPTVKHTGQTLWDGYLGQRVSYGCVILGEEESATLYQWAEVGTKVKIVPSLADYELTN
jgi:lipoprotein-anchoring transpeptidase ErfK/SrfK